MEQVAINLAPSDYWNLYWIIQLGTMWSYYWDGITDWIIECLSDVLMSYQWQQNFAIVVTRYKISYRIYSKITHHSRYHQHVSNQFVCIQQICSQVPCLSHAEGTFLHIKKPTCSGNKIVYLVTAWKLN